MPYTVDGIINVNNLSKDGWIYAGGDFDSHLNYWNIFARSKRWNPLIKPKYKPKCVCGQELEKNCWIYNSDQNRIKFIGSECINKFLDKKNM